MTDNREILDIKADEHRDRKDAEFFGGPRPLYDIAADIEANWPKVNYAAEPYLVALHQLALITDRYYSDTADDIVRRFVGNAGSWRGEHARRIKAELRDLLR